MSGGDGGLRIVACWSDPDAPTGEGSRYETEDGTVWGSVFRKESNPATGTSYGEMYRGVIWPTGR
jgi:hypothetical protein